MPPLSPGCPHALRDVPTPSALRGGAPLASVARPPPPDGARSPPEPPATADRGRTHFAGDFLQAWLCCPRVGGIPEEISAWESHPTFFGSTPSPRKEGFKREKSSLKRTERRVRFRPTRFFSSLLCLLILQTLTSSFSSPFRADFLDRSAREDLPSAPSVSSHIF